MRKLTKEAIAEKAPQPVSTLKNVCVRISSPAQKKI